MGLKVLAVIFGYVVMGAGNLRGEVFVQLNTGPAHGIGSGDRLI